MSINFEYLPVSKPSHKRNKPTARQRGSISPSVRLQLAARSKGRCERCGRGGIVLQAAHTVRRWKIESRTTVNELSHLCIECHIWADASEVGRDWLKQFRLRLLEV